MQTLSPLQLQQQNIQQWQQPNPFLRSSTRPFFYIGPSLPASSTGDITPTEKTDGDLIFDSLRQVIETRQGERLMLPSFGSRILELLGEPITKVFEHQIQRFITDAVKQWMPQVQIVGMRFAYSQQNVFITYGIQVNKISISGQGTFKLPRNS